MRPSRLLCPQDPLVPALSGADTAKGPLQRLSAVLALSVLFVFGGGGAEAHAAEGDKSTLYLEELNLPEGFEIEVWAEGVDNARGLAISPKGIVYVGSRRDGGVRAVVDTDLDGRGDKVYLLAEGLFMPSGVAWHEGDLYVAEVNRILRFDDIDSHLEAPPEPVVVKEGLPDDRHHGWKFIRFSPGGSLIVPVGAPCNVCDVEDPYAAILEMDPKTGETEVLARGVRNTVGFDFHPVTNELWFTDNGRDMMGDDLPPDELNRVARKGEHFGFPYCHANALKDPEFGDRGECNEITQPVQPLAPHVAAVGMRFYTGQQFPKRYKNSVLIAEHGSWNRTQKIGYRVMTVVLDTEGQALSYEPLVDGWLRETEVANEDGVKKTSRKAWARPADLELMADGSILISDDLNGVLYRVSYQQKVAGR